MTIWLQRLAPRPEAAVRLFCFHHAGGSAASFRQWPARLPEFDVCAVQLPGRATRMREPAPASIPAVVDALLPEILPLLDRPFAFFGHSMGTAVAWALSARLQATGRPLPAHLFLSGRQPPHKPFAEPSLHGKSDAAVVDEVQRRYGGFPAEVRAYPELLDMVLPVLRADFAALEHYTPVGEPALPVRVTALGGATDPCAALDHLLPWQRYTMHPLRILHFLGDHFYLDAGLDSIAETLRQTFAAEFAPPALRIAAA